MAATPLLARQATYTEFNVPTHNSNPSEITAAPDGNLWFTDNRGNRIGRITPHGQITEFTVPTVSSGPAGIAAEPDGSIWFTEGDGNKIGYISRANQ